MLSAIRTADGRLSIIADGRPLVVAPGHPNYDAILKALAANDVAGVLKVGDIPYAVAAYSDGRAAVAGDAVTIDGAPVHPELARRVVALMRDGLPFAPVLRFLERVEANPSFRARNELYPFLEHRGLPLDESGFFYGYKRVRDDWMDFHTGTVDNHIGQSPSMKRNLVDDDWGLECSDGYHVGAIEYVNGFYAGQGHIIIVRVDPADVVTVPRYEATKLRTCRYTVVAEYRGVLDESPLYDKAVRPVVLAAPVVPPVVPPAAAAPARPEPAAETYCVRVEHADESDDERDYMEDAGPGWTFTAALDKAMTAAAAAAAAGNHRVFDVVRDSATNRIIGYRVEDEDEDLVAAFMVVPSAEAHEDDADDEPEEEDDEDEEENEDEEDDDEEEEEDDEEEDTAYSYRYLVPGQRCPRCHADLAVNNAVAVELAVAGQRVIVTSRLTRNLGEDGGDLLDTPDEAIARGFHSQTRCGTCDFALTPWEQLYRGGRLARGPASPAEVGPVEIPPLPPPPMALRPETPRPARGTLRSFFERFQRRGS